jgi:hypothetical protein
VDIVAEGVQGNGDLAARLVDPLADLWRFVDGDAGGYYDRRGDDDACGSAWLGQGGSIGVCGKMERE